MNDGIIASRYAKALLRLTQETGRGAQVAGQVSAMLDNPDVLPSPLEDDLVRMVQLIRDRHRETLLKRIFHMFLKLYYESEHIKQATLTTVVPAPELEQKLKDLVEKKTGCKVVMKTAVDESLIGGFVFEIDDYMLDASVRNQIDTLRRQFVQKNTRIV